MNTKTIEQLISSERFFNEKLLTEKDVRAALDICIRKIDRNINLLGDNFPTPTTFNQTYKPMDNTEWTNGFWTGELWLAYEYTNDEKYKHVAMKHVESFYNRIKNKIEVEHHDLGFLYIPSCVAAYKLTGDTMAREAALMAAEQLASRYQEKGGFIQAWGELGARDNYRLIVDCLLNIPLLYWAYEETGEERYRNMAVNHYHTTVKYAIRNDASAYHTYYFNPDDGMPVGGKTRQGYSDNSCWARGQSWLIYGNALNYSHIKEDCFDLFRAVSNYFLNRLPEDFICYWDLIFGDGSGQAKDSSAAAITVCGFSQMEKYLPDTIKEKEVYHRVKHIMLANLIEGYTENLADDGPVALINHGVYSWHSGKGVNEGNLWGDYFYMEALIRFIKDWNMYW